MDWGEIVEGGGKMMKQVLFFLLVILGLTSGISVEAETAVWVNAAGGPWSTAANWQGGNGPGPGTNADINMDGTYTSSVSGVSTALDVAVGTTSASGVQTLNVGQSLTFTNLTVGPKGIVTYANNSTFNGDGVVTVSGGGLLARTSGSRQGGFSDHDVVVEPGANWTFAAGCVQSIWSPVNREVNYRIDGAMGGGGVLNLNNNGKRGWFTGNGSISVAAIVFNADNGYLYMAGGLTVDSAIIQTNSKAGKGTLILSNNASLTLNGPYSFQKAGNMLMVLTNDDSVALGGTNVIQVWHDDSGSDCLFMGYKSNTSYVVGGTLTLAGSGSLEIYEGSTNKQVKLQAAALNLQRDARFWGANGAVAVRATGPLSLNASGAGRTLTLDTNAVLNLWNSNTVLNVNGGMTLALRDGTLEGGSKGPAVYTNVVVGLGSAGTLALREGSTNLFRRTAEVTNPLCVLLGPEAVVSPEPASVLQLSVCSLAAGITNGSSWGWKTQGSIECLSNATVEAMSSDRGTNVLFSADPFGVKSMACSCANNMTLTLANAGADNDKDSTTDAALYVDTLNLSGMGVGTTLGLAGAGIVEPRVYYATLVNPAGVTLDAKILPLTAQQGSVSCTITNDPVPAGAQWRLTTGADTSWKNSGDSVSVEFGTYTQSFKAVGGYTTPSDLAVEVLSGQATNTLAHYESDVVVGSIQVTLAPVGAVSGGARWRLTTGYETNWQDSGAVVAGLPAGTYTVTYKPGVPHWYSPADDMVSVSADSTNSLTGTYAAIPVYGLVVESVLGNVVPSAGSTNIEEGQIVACGVGNSPIIASATQFVCTGWVRTGSSAGSGSTTNSSFTMTAATTQTWSWATNYLLHTVAGPNGSVDQDGTWCRRDSNVLVTATGDPGYGFTAWSGDVPGGSEAGNPLNLTMDQPRSVSASFAPIVGQTAIWTNTAGGMWSTAANWQDGVLPGDGTNADINANGTYSVTVDASLPARNIALGNTSLSGSQSLVIASADLMCSNLTVGGRGRVTLNHTRSLTGTGMVTVASGGQLIRPGSASAGDYGNHEVTVQAGGEWTLSAGAMLTLVETPWTMAYTIDGRLDGDGTILCNNLNNRLWLTGAGTVSVARIDLNDNNGNLFLGGSLTIGSTINQSNANNSAVVLSNNASVTFDGPYFMQRAGKALLLYTNTASATVTGTNLISINHDTDTMTAVFTGTKFGASGGTLTLAGSGALDVNQASTNRLELLASVLNLQRTSRFRGIDNAGPLRPGGAFALNYSGTGKTLTLDTNSVLRLWNSNTVMRVGGEATLALRNGIVEGGSTSAGSYTNLVLGQGSPAALVLEAGSTNQFRRAAESAADMSVLLGADTTVTPAPGSALRLENCRFGVAIPMGAAWGWRTEGTLILGTNVVLEALNSDKGAAYLLDPAHCAVEKLSLQAPGSLALTLFNDGAADNDGDLATDSAVYVDRLDLSGMGAGSTVTVAAATGSGIVTPWLYYRQLVNPNGVVLGTGVCSAVPAGAVYVVR